MPRYMFLARHNGECPSTNMSPEEMQQTMEKYMAWVAKLEPKGQLLASEKLADGSGRILDQSGGIVKDGPFSESKEVIGGFSIVQAADFDEAVAIARDLPFGEGTLEIREIEEHGG